MTGRFEVSHDCGFTSTTGSQAQAVRSLRIHSCEKARAIAERKARGDAQRAAIDRTPKPCLHKKAAHRHGTRACYVLDKCRCGRCAADNAQTERHRLRQQAYGRWQPYVDAQPTREHVERLRAAGMGLKQIAKASGVSHGVLSKLIYGERGMAPSKRVRWETAVRLQVVHADLDTLVDRNPVDGTGTRRRVQALVAIGWSQSKLCERLGMERGNFWRIMESRDRVRASTARAVSQLYDELWDTEPPATNQRERISVNRSLRYARERGWAPPLAWDEGGLDDPNAIPNTHGHDEERVRAVLNGALINGDEDLELALTVDDRLAVLRHCRDVWRVTTTEASRLTGISMQAFRADQARQSNLGGSSSQLDEVAVERIMAGTLRETAFHNSPERIEAIRRLVEFGWTDREVGDRVGISQDAVLKIRARKDIPAAMPTGRTA